MNRIKLIDGYDEKRVRDTLDHILRDKKNEFRELSESIGIPVTADDWEVIVLKFCLDFEDCLKVWRSADEPSSVRNTKCMTIMREIASGGKPFTEIIHLENIAHVIFTEFHQTYERIT